MKGRIRFQTICKFDFIFIRLSVFLCISCFVLDAAFTAAGWRVRAIFGVLAGLVCASELVLAVLEMKSSLRILHLLFYVILCCLITVIQHDLLVYQFLVVILSQGELLKVEIECTDRLARWLIVREMQLF